MPTKAEKKTSSLIGFPHWIISRLFNKGPQNIMDILEGAPKFTIEDLLDLHKMFLHISIDLTELKIYLTKPKNLNEYGMLVGLFLQKHGPMDVHSCELLFPSTDFNPLILVSNFANFGFDANTHSIYIKTREALSKVLPVKDNLEIDYLWTKEDIGNEQLLVEVLFSQEDLVNTILGILNITKSYPVLVLCKNETDIQYLKCCLKSVTETKTNSGNEAILDNEQEERIIWIQHIKVWEDRLQALGNTSDRKVIINYNFCNNLKYQVSRIKIILCNSGCSVILFQIVHNMEKESNLLKLSKDLEDLFLCIPPFLSKYNIQGSPTTLLRKYVSMVPRFIIRNNDDCNFEKLVQLFTPGNDYKIILLIIQLGRISINDRGIIQYEEPKDYNEYMLAACNYLSRNFRATKDDLENILPTFKPNLFLEEFIKSAYVEYRNGVIELSECGIEFQSSRCSYNFFQRTVDVLKQIKINDSIKNSNNNLTSTTSNEDIKNQFITNNNDRNEVTLGIKEKNISLLNNKSIENTQIDLAVVEGNESRLARKNLPDINILVQYTNAKELQEVVFRILLNSTRGKTLILTPDDKVTLEILEYLKSNFLPVEAIRRTEAGLSKKTLEHFHLNIKPIIIIESSIYKNYGIFQVATIISALVENIWELNFNNFSLFQSSGKRVFYHVFTSMNYETAAYFNQLMKGYNQPIPAVIQVRMWEVIEVQEESLIGVKKVQQDVLPVFPENKRNQLCMLLEEFFGYHIVVFAKSRRQIEILCKELSREYPITCLFKEMHHHVAKQSVNDYTMKLTPILITNDDIFNMPLRVKQVFPVVINYELPTSFSRYIERCKLAEKTRIISLFDTEKDILRGPEFAARFLFSGQTLPKFLIPFMQ